MLAMEASKPEMEALCQALQRLLTQLRFKMRASARQRLAFDMVVLCSGLRPAVMVDYAGPVLRLVEQLPELLSLLSLECRVVRGLRLLYLLDCVYLIHVANLRRYLDYTSKPGNLPDFVILTKNSARVASAAERADILLTCKGLKAEIFRCVLFPPETDKLPDLPCTEASKCEDDERANGEVLIDLHDKEFDVLLPTANGWLLAYPIVYTFSKEEASEAGRHLAMTDLHLYRVSLVSCLPALTPSSEDVLRFSVPRSLSPLAEKESWVSRFLEFSLGSPHPEIWRNLHVDVVLPSTQGVVL